jgi:hypothetical protein
VLLTCQNQDCNGDKIFSTIKSYYNSLGASLVDEVYQLPADLSKYRLVVIISPSSYPTAAEVSSLKNFIKGGGRLVFTVWPDLGNVTVGNIAVGNNWLTQIGVPISVTGDNAGNSDCPTKPNNSNSYAPHPLTGDLPTTGVYYTTATTLNINPQNPGVLLSPPGALDKTILAVYPHVRTTRGDVVVAGGDFFTAYCNLKNQKLWANLFLNMDDDNDGLLNDWEIRGYDADGNGTIDVNLPAMGANSKHKDIFVEIDWMEGCPGSRKPTTGAIGKIVQAFANAPVKNPDGIDGITLHIDYGQGGLFTGGTKIACVDTLIWPEDFQPLKTANFDAKKRQRIFHYSIWANFLEIPGEGRKGGAGEQGGDDLVISLGTSRGNDTSQAGIFMHELGHNLGLNHGGVGNYVDYKPNHLSVMNYSFTLTGLILDSNKGTIDYGRSSPPALNELALNEKIGLNGGPAVTPYGTVWYCQGSNDRKETDFANAAIDWNCKDGIDEANVSSDINQSPRSAKSALTSPGLEWSSVRLASPSSPGIPSGGRLGSQLRSQMAQGSETEVPSKEPSLEELLEGERSMDEFLRRIEPTKPQEIKTQRVGSHSVLVTWKPPRIPQIEGQSIIGYEVFRHEEHDRHNAVVLVKTTTNLSFLDNNVVRGKTYIYKVVALTKNFRRTGSSAPVTIP